MPELDFPTKEETMDIKDLQISGEPNSIEWAQKAITAMIGCREPESFLRFMANLVEEIKSGEYDPDELAERMKDEDSIRWLMEKWYTERKD